MTDTDRREQLAREHAERQARRAEQEARAKRNVAVGIGVGAVVVIGGIIAATALLGGGGDGDATAAADPSASASASAPATVSASPSSSGPAKAGPITCKYRDDDSGAPAKNVGRPPARVGKAVLALKTMTIKTNLGDIVIDLFTDKAPCTVNSFNFLAKKHFFDNTVCHRLATPDTAGLGLLQCGDPQAKGDGKNPTDGTGGPGYLFDDENPGGSDYRRGVVFMAQGMEDKNANGSQFAISYHNDNTQLAALGGTYTAFGMISKGMDIIDKVSKGGVLINEGDITSTEGGATAPKMRVEVKTVVLR
ncbi:peptidylprolyl isomerase [Thermopolyspora sp. NPDC052614]|uniref:peptidylprolyl isomerase n=1 Tax=Thermopolyspora sp. NPDC052614 TaxID=3155682 RepID=UPI003441DEC1